MLRRAVFRFNRAVCKGWCFRVSLGQRVTTARGDVPSAPGHTARNYVIEVQAAGHTLRLVMIGDTWTQQPLQFDTPMVNVQVGLNYRQAIFSRLHMLDLFTPRGDLVMSDHDTFLILGLVQSACAPDVTASYH